MKCITCDIYVICADPFESGRCEVCFTDFMQRPHNRLLNNEMYWREEKIARQWYGESSDDRLRKKADMANIA